MSVFLFVCHEKWPLPKKVCLSICLFYSPFLKKSVCLSRKRNTFQEGSSLTHLNPTLIPLTPPAGPVRDHNSWALKAGSRHGICQIFYTARFPTLSILPQKNASIATFLAKNWEWTMFFSSILKKNCQFSCNYLLTQIQTHSFLSDPSPIIGNACQ